MAVVGTTEVRPKSTTSRETYAVMVCRCLLCGAKADLHCSVSRECRVVPFCSCYDEGIGTTGLTQPVRIIPND